MNKKTIECITILLFFSALGAVFFYKSIFSGRIPFPGDLLISEYQPWRSSSFLGYVPGSYPSKFQYSDTVRQLYPWKMLAVDMMKRGDLPLWNPHNFSGSPLLPAQPALFYFAVSGCVDSLYYHTTFFGRTVYLLVGPQDEDRDIRFIARGYRLCLFIVLYRFSGIRRHAAYHTLVAARASRHRAIAGAVYPVVVSGPGQFTGYERTGRASAIVCRRNRVYHAVRFYTCLT